MLVGFGSPHGSPIGELGRDARYGYAFSLLIEKAHLAGEGKRRFYLFMKTTNPEERAAMEGVWILDFNERGELVAHQYIGSEVLMADPRVISANLPKEAAENLLKRLAGGEDEHD